MKHIVILGGGYGGVLTAKKLANRLKKHRDVRITIIDRRPFHTLLTELHEIVGNRCEEDSIKVELSKIFVGFKNVTVVMDEITEIDFDHTVLRSELNSYPYDYLVIGTGSKPTFWGTPGAEENSFTLWSYEDAIKLREHIPNMFRAAVKERNPERRAEMLTFVVVGAGFTGVEVIGEIAEYTQELCKEFYVDPIEVQLHVVDILEKILPTLPDPLIEKSAKKLRKLGVSIDLKSKITAVKKHAVCMGDNELPSRTIIWTAGVEGSDLVGTLDLEQKGRKRIQTNDKLQTLEHENVYIVGDNIFFIPEGQTAPVPQMVENAEAAAPIIAFNIAADIKKEVKKVYKPTFHGTMVCIGSRYGVAYVGTPKRMYQVSGFFAMLIKHMINMLYFFQICGFNKVYSYMLHEFFHVRNNRSFVGGHLAKRSPNFWLVPLRVFVGLMWFIEGFEKLIKIWKDPAEIFLIPAKAVDGVAAASAEVDPASAGAATDAVAGAAVEVTKTTYETALWVPGFVKDIVDWSMDLMFFKSNGDFNVLAYIFQGGMVVAELVIGCLLMAGLFTALASIASVGMGAMIWVSSMAPLDMLWYMIGSVALIGGSGSTLGLDYYVLPWLKKYYKRIPIVRRWYIYSD
jgi:NADH dehydrogenase